MPFRLKLAIAMGAASLLAGTLIYVTWRVTRWDWLQGAGLLTIFWGLLAFAIGSIALLSHLYNELQMRPLQEQLPETRNTRFPLWLQGLLVGSLLLVNFPAAAFYVNSAIDVKTRYTVRIHNESDQVIETLVLLGPGVDVQVGPIPSGDSVRQHLWFQGDGPLLFKARQQDLEFGGEVDGYVTGGVAGEQSITIRNGGEFDIVTNPD